MSSASTKAAEPPIMSRLLHGTFWLALKTPVAMVVALWSIPLTQRYIGPAQNGAYLFAWDFGVLQLMLEFGMGSVLQKQMSDAWARGDRDGVDRTIACGMTFYAVIGLIQMVLLLAIAQGGLRGEFRGNSLVIGLLWIQIASTPFTGLSAVTGSVLQAARRYDFVPRLELAIIVLRFALLGIGYWSGASYLLVVAGQVAVQIGLSLLPSLYVMTRELGHRPHFGGARRSDYAALLHISLYMALLQWSVVLADKLDVIVLGYALTGEHVGERITIYQNVSKPFFQIRQTGWTLTYLVMPVVVNLAVAGDRLGLERIKYDGTRYVVALLAPVALLAGIYAAPFLTLWVGPEFAPHAWMLRLFLVATLPLCLQVIGQMALGMGHLKVPALASIAGALVNLPLSYVLTRHMGVSGVIWGTVLTTLVSNLLIPGVYFFRTLEVRPATFLSRALAAPIAGAAALVAGCAAAQLVVSPWPTGPGVVARLAPFLFNLAAGCLAYLAGYGATPTGRADLAVLLRKLVRRRGVS